ncbi:MAG: hypothetical protein GC191_11720 [Azospirillum sp.]|nr:hypothetical protein [Azospirillum sp.]
MPRIMIGSKTYDVAELGMRNFKISPYSGDLIAKQRFDFRLLLEFEGKTTEIPIQGMVMKVDQEGLHGHFGAPQPFHQKKLMAFLTVWRMRR